ncbi:hypothetical protein B484DRAFT_441338 [Ochromonadaceae sp. CCMP2298]|nr:hypothetical protein B484DRAFT_441338 [Ochromonadaceae sp. CCMP2298]
MHHTAEEEINALYQIARELLRRGARCDLPGPSGDVLGDICWLDLLPDEQSIVAMVGDAIRNGAEVNATVGVGKRTPLCLVANRGDRPALMAFLLAQGAVDSETSYEGRTPLMGCRALIEAAGFRLRGFAGRAIVHTRMQTVRLLLQHGALIDGISEQWWGMKGHYSEGVGGTALHDAYKASNFDVAKQLERAGALPLPDRKGRLPWECRNLTEYGRYMDERWECRKSFVIILRELGLTSGAGAGVGGSGVLLRMLATREVQSNIASYL